MTRLPSASSTHTVGELVLGELGSLPMNRSATILPLSARVAWTCSVGLQGGTSSASGVSMPPEAPRHLVERGTSSADTFARDAHLKTSDAAAPTVAVVVRLAVKLLLLDGEGCVLLIHGKDPRTGAECWYPVGGGVEPGETLQEAAAREAYEETGLAELAVGSPVWWRDHTYEFDGRAVEVHEEWLMHRVDGSPRCRRSSVSTKRAASWGSGGGGRRSWWRPRRRSSHLASASCCWAC
ncbi:NUDIX domain-containing protein [Kribbella flavida]|uniref:NUDIX domain-containing protein n=1 Tax=Kribbella flavida TaxID=182640 RepID=UPI000A062118